MTLAEFEQRIVESSSEHWQLITCWGAGSGSSYLHEFSVWTKGDMVFGGIEVETPGMLAVLKTDISIKLAWGLSHNNDFKEEWANQFSDPHASSSFLDFFYNGSLVYRDIYVSVDGARCRLPLPEVEYDKDTHEVKALKVVEQRARFFQMFDAFEQVSDWHRYFRRTGIQIVQGPWMGSSRI